MTDATEPKGLGLLRGVDVETSLNYSNKLIYSEDLLSKDGVFWAAAEADALSCGKSVESYLEDIQERFKTFMRSDDVFDRTDLKKGVRALIMQQNEISIALGAKSIGKTKVFQSVVNEITTEKGDVLVVYVNARDHASGSLAKGIQLALSRLDKLDFFKKVDWGTVRQSLAEFLALTHEKAGEIATTMNNLHDAMHVCGNVEDVVDADINFVHLIIALAEQRQQHPCLIIDEAKLCLPGGEREDSIINQFLHVTKEEQRDECDPLLLEAFIPKSACCKRPPAWHRESRTGGRASPVRGLEVFTGREELKRRIHYWNGQEVGESVYLYRRR